MPDSSGSDPGYMIAIGQTMFTANSITVVTPAAGYPGLARCIDSVQAQTFPNVEHLLIIDGLDHVAAVRQSLAQLRRGTKPLHLLPLPVATGKEKWNGHRIYGASAFLVNTEFIAWLDEDNWYAPDHLQCMHDALTREKTSWAYTFRNVVDANGEFLVKDECESLGPSHCTFLGDNDYLIDTSCYLLRRELAVTIAPLWYGPARPAAGPERDRAICQALMQKFPPGACSGRYTLNYTVAHRPDSVQARFFQHGNALMRIRYPEGLPWEIAGIS